MITNLTVSEESFESLANYYADPDSNLKWDLVFTLPAWLQVWWQNFGSGAELYLRSVKQNEKILGIAPLQIRNNRASICGSVNVCDYQDFITVEGLETDFFNAVMDDLIRKGVESLDLETIRPDSAITEYLMPLAQKRQYTVDYQQVDVSLDMSLPQDWETYLGSLDRKQRHELRRKIRNLQDAGGNNYHVAEDKKTISEATNTFLQLFPDYRQDKAEFLTAEMQTYFRSLSEALVDTGILKYGILEIGQQVAAMILYFDFHNIIYLYNSAYAPEYRSLSVGIISKARCVQDSIEKTKSRFDFLKGNEQYKYYLGGKEIPLYRCRIILK